jgi:pilus assembly protein CpaF
LEGLALAAGLPLAAVHSQLASAVHVVVHCRRDSGGGRRVGEVAVLDRDPGGAVRAVPAVTFAVDGRAVEEEAASVLARRLEGP